jgi:hypothetical protein
MMLMLLLTELTCLEVQLSVESDGLHIQAPGGAVTDELRHAITERQEAWRYKIEVMSLRDGVERFYWPRIVLQARSVDMAHSEGIPP